MSVTALELSLEKTKNTEVLLVQLMLCCLFQWNFHLPVIIILVED